jgi:hypothetical protein
LRMEAVMPGVSSTPLPEQEPPPIVRADQTALFLRGQGVFLQMIANYEDHLEEAIFRREQPDGDDRKLLLKYRRVLRSIDSLKTFLIIWKESEFVDDQALAQAGLCRTYQGRDLTAYSLATDFAGNSPKLVAKLNSRIRMIALAAAAHQLVDRAGVHSTKVILKGTPVLHEFMSSLSAKNILAMSSFGPLPTITIAATND